MAKMKAAIIKSPGNIVIKQVDIPQPAEDEVLVKVLAVGICGSDRRIWEGTHWIPDEWPMAPGEHGHESAGEVIEMGSKVKNISIGDSVVRIGPAFCEYTLAKEPIVAKNGEPEILCFAEPLGCALQVAEQTQSEPGDTVLIMGQGSIGLMVTQLLIQKDVNVVATDIVDKKLKLAASFGAHTIDARDPNYISKISTKCPEIKTVVECAGSPKNLDAACELVAAGGNILIFGVQQRFSLPYKPLRKKGIQINFPTATYDFRKNRDYWQEAVDILCSNTLQIEPLISARKPLDELPHVFAHYDEQNWIKVLILPQL